MYALEKKDIPPYAQPLSSKITMKHQQKDKDLLKSAKNNVDYVAKYCTAAGHIRK